MSSFEEVPIGAPPAEEEDVLVRAERLACDKCREATHAYREKLLVSESAVQANRLVLNLEETLGRRAAAGEDVSGALDEVAASRAALAAALAADDAPTILAVEGDVERLTLKEDPFYLEGEEKRREERRIAMEEKGRATWMSQSSNKVIQLMKGDTQGKVVVTRAERRSCISKAAWAFAISGMIIAIAFLVVDFYTAQKNPVLRTVLMPRKELELPVLTYCMALPNIGSFQDVKERGLRGNALFGVTEFTNYETQTTLTSDEAHEQMFEPLVLGPESCKSKMNSFSKEQMALVDPRINSTTRRIDTDECFSCFRSKSSKPITLQSDRAQQIGRPPIRVRLARSKLLDYCFPGVAKWLEVEVLDALVDLLKKHAPELVERGTLSVMDRVDIAWALDKLRTSSSERVCSHLSTCSETEHHEAVAGLLCNVYFFSGYFLPAEGDFDARYHFSDLGTNNQGNLAWRAVGAGPYHRVFMDLARERDVATRVKSIEAELVAHTSRTGLILPRVFVFAMDRSQDRLPSINDHAVSITPASPMVLTFTRSVDHGVPGYTSELTAGTTREGVWSGALYSDFLLDIGFTSFTAEITSRRPATSVAEFLTDVFEYAGLFTGVCAYSILVAPARMYLRRPTTRQGQQ